MRVVLPMLGIAAAVVLGAPPRRPAGSELTIVFSGEMKGYLSPCGCTKPMLGGIARRGAVIQRIARGTRPVLLENGDLTPAEGRQDELKAETIADSLSALGYDAVGLGELDLELGSELLQALQDRMGARLICANLSSPLGRTRFSRSVILRRSIAGANRAILVTSVIPTGTRVPDEFTLTDPAAALRPLARTGDIRILLYHGRRQGAEALARAVPGFALIVYAHGPDTPAPPIRAGKSTLVCAGTSGKYLGVAALDAGGKALRVSSMALDETVGISARIEAIRKAYLARVASENLLEMLPRRPLISGASYAGSDACAGCHANAHRVWRASSHARAMRTLRAVGQDRDPECVPCHAVGVEHEGGYLDRKLPSLAHVGCENCHGPSARHVGDQSVRPPRGGKSSCAPCHVPAHSPAYRYDTYWSKIRH